MTTPPPDHSQPDPQSNYPPQPDYRPQPMIGPPPSKKPIILGALIGLAGIVLSSLVTTLGDAVLRRTGISAGLILSPIWLVPLVGFIMIFPERTRRWGAGILLGVALSVVVGFAACVGLFLTYATSSGQ